MGLAASANTISPNALTFGLLAEHRSHARMSTYLAAAQGDADLAEQIYDWNWELTAAFLQVIGRLEVKLRNACDQAIAAGLPGRPHWAFDPASPVVCPASGQLGVLNRHSRDQIRTVVARLGRIHPGRVLSSDDVVGNLSFGFWRTLPVKAREKSLWIPLLHRGFVAGASRREVEDLFRVAHVLRNRCAHHEPIFTRPLKSEYEKLLRLASLVGPGVGSHIAAQSWVPAVLVAAPLGLRELWGTP